MIELLLSWRGGMSQHFCEVDLQMIGVGLSIFGLDIAAGALDDQDRAAIAGRELLADGTEIIGGDVVIIRGEHVGMGGDAQQQALEIVGIAAGDLENAQAVVKA